MDDTTRKIFLTIGAGLLKKAGLALGMAAATHGWISGNDVELFGAGAVALGTAGWSFWNDYGRAIVLSQLEVLKAKSLAQAEQARSAGLPPVTSSQIAEQSPTLTPKDVAKVVSKLPGASVIILAVVLAGLLSGGAHAQGLLPKPRPAASLAAPGDPLQQLMDQIAAKKAEFITNVVAAIQEADDDAATLTNPTDPGSFRDPIAHACYPAQIKFLQSLPQVQAIKAPAPYNMIVLFQRKRDLVAQIKAGLPGYLKVGCAALLNDEKTILLQTLGMIGVTVGAGALTGVFPAIAPITLPALAL